MAIKVTIVVPWVIYFCYKSVQLVRGGIHVIRGRTPVHAAGRPIRPPKPAPQDSRKKIHHCSCPPVFAYT